MKPPAKAPLTLSDLLALHERLLIVQTLSRHDFSRKRAAEALGITRLDLWRRMRKLKIDVKRTSPGRPSKTVKEN
jgi:DNA-binding NtrC family response regulator